MKDREGSKDQEEDGCDAQAATVVTASSSSDLRNAAQVSTASIDISRPAPLSEPTSTQHIPAATSASVPPLPAAKAADSAETSVDTNDTTANLPVRIWDRAYDLLKEEEAVLVDVYEKILSRQLQNGLGSAVPASQPNHIAQHDPDTRRSQMKQLVHAGLDRIAREAKAKEALGGAVDVVLSARDIISSVIQATPQAALAWSGVCVGLEVSPSGKRCFAC